MRDEFHVLLVTGRPRVGKTTLARKVAERLSDRFVRGFVTEEHREDGKRVGFRLTTFGDDEDMLAHVDFDSPHRVGRYGVDVQALDFIAEDELDPDKEADLYVIDEIGKMECLSEVFRDRVRALLDSGRPVVATVARTGDGLIAEVKDRPDTRVVEVTLANRDLLPGGIARWVEDAWEPPGREEER